MNSASTSGIASGNGGIEAIEIDVSTETRATMIGKLATCVRDPLGEAMPVPPKAQTENYLSIWRSTL